MLNPSNLRYIVFLIDSKNKQHDGKIFSSHASAKDYAEECVDGVEADKAVIGMFYNDMQVEFMQITMVETIGFHRDKKKVEQLSLFK